MKHLLIRIEMVDYDRWLDVHYAHAADRQAYGMEDGPVYRDIDNPNAALFHIRTRDLERAMEWFRSDTFREATRRATVSGREFYVTEMSMPAQTAVAAG
jgi:heme-degrading monooxygenase HmoA